MSDEWHETDSELPPEGVEVIGLNGTIEQPLVYDDQLWWFPDRSMYVYFRPRMWRLPR